MDIQTEIVKQIELGFTKEEITENLLNEYPQEEVFKAIKDVNWSGANTKKGRSLSGFTKVTGILFILAVVALLALPNMAKANHNFVMAVIYLSGILTVLSLFTMKR